MKITGGPGSSQKIDISAREGWCFSRPQDVVGNGGDCSGCSLLICTMKGVGSHSPEIDSQQFWGFHLDLFWWWLQHSICSVWQKYKPLAGVCVCVCRHEYTRKKCWFAPPCCCSYSVLLTWDRWVGCFLTKESIDKIFFEPKQKEEEIMKSRVIICFMK